MALTPEQEKIFAAVINVAAGNLVRTFFSISELDKPVGVDITLQELGRRLGDRFVTLYQEGFDCFPKSVVSTVPPRYRN